MKIILHIIIKEFLQLKRDPKLFAIIFFAPVFQLILLGYAATMDINNVSTAVYDQDKTSVSRDFVEKFQSSGYFSVESYIENYDQATELINYGKVLCVIVIPDDFKKKLGRGEQVQLQVILDGSDGNKASIAFGYINGVVSSFSQDILLDQRDKTGLKTSFAGILTPELRVWYNPDLKTRNFMVPGIIGLLLTVITTVLMAMGIVKEREIGTLEQIIVSPIKPYQLIVGKIIPFVILGFLDVLLVIAVMVFWFGIGIRGDFFYLMFASFLYVLSALGIGLFVSTVSKTQQQAMMVAMFGILMPMNFLSGFAFPIENMPQWVQPITYVLPLTYYIDILRSVILKGDGLLNLLPETIILLAMGILILYLSALRFKKRLE
ncbi:MAG: ABC transporter permease [Ignavibacteriaceae bacterium]